MKDQIVESDENDSEDKDEQIQELKSQNEKMKEENLSLKQKLSINKASDDRFDEMNKMNFNLQKVIQEMKETKAADDIREQENLKVQEELR